MRIYGIDDLPEAMSFTLRNYFRLPADVYDKATDEEMVGLGSGVRCLLFSGGRNADGKWQVLGYPFVVDAQEAMRAQPRSLVYVMVENGEMPWPSQG